MNSSLSKAEPDAASFSRHRPSTNLTLPIVLTLAQRAIPYLNFLIALFSNFVNPACQPLTFYDSDFTLLASVGLLLNTSTLGFFLELLVPHEAYCV